jgi:hypothetical protein
MPYKATYSSSWVLSDSAKYVQAELRSMKDYEDNKVDNAPAYFGDIVDYDFFKGAKIKLKFGSFIKALHQYRD